MKNKWTIMLTLLASLASFATSAQEIIKVGMSGRYYPFTFFEKNQLKGFEVDMWQEIGKRADLKPEFVTANFSGLFGMLESGRIDTISHNSQAARENANRDLQCGKDRIAGNADFGNLDYFFFA